MRLDAERPSSDEHLEFLVALYADPAVARWHWPGSDGGPRSPDQSRELQMRGTGHWQEHGFGWWLWRDRARGALVAQAGPAWTVVGGKPAIEIGWSVPVAEQGRGYATEAAIAALCHSFGELDLEEIVSFTWAENVPSRRVMEKAGLGFEREFVHAGLPHVLHVARAIRWSPP